MHFLFHGTANYHCCAFFEQLNFVYFITFPQLTLADSDLSMRLLRIEDNGEFSLVDYEGSSVPPYAILSHRWGPNHEEVNYEDLIRNTGKKKAGYRKLTFCAKQALRDDLQFFWVDTCCIDKSNSVEYSEAINSMFRWYQDAKLCYVYLSDVFKSTPNWHGKSSWKWKRAFKKSKWFTRGWTLQELLAPKDVIFYDRNGNMLGTKSEHAHWISKITAIDTEALLDSENTHVRTERLKSFCVAKKMSWASRRTTSRTEDMAYCLLGIFDVNMPLLYGEGERAFIRLQEEILKNYCDDSILAWGLDSETRYPRVPDFEIDDLSRSSILASSPKDFESCGSLVYATARDSSFHITNLGLEIELPMVPVCSPPQKDARLARNKHNGWIGLLSCSPGTHTELVGITLLSPSFDADPNRYVERAPLSRGDDEEQYNTVIVGPRVAARSVLRKVTIILEKEGRRPREYFLGCRQIVVNQSKTFRSTGYHVMSGTALNIAENEGGWGYTPIWDAGRMLLTIEDKRRSKDLLKFCFEAQWLRRPRTTFTIFLRTASKRAMVRGGSTFSKEDMQSFYDLLNDGYQGDDVDGMVITDCEEDSFRVVVTMNETAVYGRRIFEVEVDALYINSGIVA
jgi:hypothetical protein